MVSPDQGSPRSSLSQLKADGSASVGELREFLGEFKGKDPREVMGVIADSGLARSIFVATLACVLILAAGTAGPYFLGWSGSQGDAQSKKAKKPGVKTAGQQSSKKAQPAAKKNLAARAKANKQEAAKKMGLTETKQADPNKNPLDVDDKLKSLLDGKK